MMCHPLFRLFNSLLIRYFENVKLHIPFMVWIKTRISQLMLHLSSTSSITTSKSFSNLDVGVELHVRVGGHGPPKIYENIIIVYRNI